jgi:hypothetical protein
MKDLKTMNSLYRTPITESQRNILLHALGSSHRNKLGWRNYFMCDDTDPEVADLCQKGFMVKVSSGNAVFPDSCFRVTPEAAAMLKVTLEPCK